VAKRDDLPESAPHTRTHTQQMERYKLQQITQRCYDGIITDRPQNIKRLVIQ